MFNNFLCVFQYNLNIILGILLLVCTSSFTSIQHFDKDKDQKFIIIIDAGHGGHDPGCIGHHSEEKDISLDIALKLGTLLKSSSQEISIIYTREKDVFVPLHKRIDIANKNKADLFISIHCNSSSNKSAHGTESYVMGLHRTEENLNVAKRENNVIVLEEGYDKNYGQYDPNSPAGHIILSMFQNIHLDQSINIAQQIETNLSNRNQNSRGVKQAGFVVLRNATMPSILVEAGFLSNSKDEKYLLSDIGKTKVAQSISKAIIEYIKEEKKEGKKHISKAINKDNKTAVKKTIGKNKSSKKDKRKNVISKNTYCIQLAATTHKTIDLKKGKWSKINDIVIIKTEKLYKYYTKSYPSREKAEVRKSSLKAMGFKGAFIIQTKDLKSYKVSQLSSK